DGIRDRNVTGVQTCALPIFKQENPLEIIESVIDKETIIEAKRIYSQVHVSDDLFGYIMDVVEKTRSRTDIEMGVSPRGSQSLLKIGRASCRERVLRADASRW